MTDSAYTALRRPYPPRDLKCRVGIAPILCLFFEGPVLEKDNDVLRKEAPPREERTCVSKGRKGIEKRDTENTATAQQAPRQKGQDRTANVAIRVRQPSGKTIQKLAVMWHPAGSDNEDVNLASAKLITEVLGMDVQRGPSTLRLHGNDVEVQGFVDIEWSVCEQSRRKRIGSAALHSGRFGVTAQEDPPFDLLVGRKLARESGLDGH